MNKDFTARSLTDDKIWGTVLLTFFLLIPQNLFAFESDSNFPPMPLVSGPRQQSALAEADRKQRLSQLWGYARNQAAHLVPGLPNAMNASFNLALSELSAAGENAGLGSLKPETARSGSAPMPLAGESEGEAAWFSSNYHHKGFLPAHDAMMMGFNYRRLLMDNRAQFDIGPFYGQNWMSDSAIWGFECKMKIAPTPQERPWGKVVLRYDSGDEAMMDHGHGYDVHGEARIDAHLSLNAGARQDDDQRLGHYVLMRWKLADNE